MEKQEVSIVLTVDKWNIVMQSLGNMPYGQVAAIIAEMQGQALSQLKNDNVK